MALAVGVDLGRRYVRAVVVDQSGSTTTITSLREERVQGGDRLEALGEILSHIPKHAQLGITIPLESAQMRPVEFPFGDDDKIRETIRFKMEPLLEGAIDDHLIDYHSMQSDENRTAVLGFGMRLDEVSKIIETAQAAGCDPQRVNLDIFSLGTLFSLKYSQPDAPTAFVDIAADGCRIVVLKGGRLCFVRSLRQGTQWLVSYIANQCEISHEEAAEACFATDLAPRVEAVRQRGLEELAVQVRRSLLSAQQESYSDIFISGEGVYLPAIDILFKKQLGEGVVVVAAMEGFAMAAAVEEDVVPAEYAIALGEAIVAGGRGELAINLRRDQLSYRGLEDKIRSAALICAALCGFVALAFGGLNLREHLSLQQQLRSVEDEQRTIFGAVMPPSKDPDFYINSGLSLATVLSGELRKLKEDLPSTSNSGTKKNASSLGLMKELLLALGAKLDVKIEYVDIKESSGTLRGWSSDFATAEMVSSKISSVRGITAAKPKMRSKDDGVSFSIRLEVK